MLFRSHGSCLSGRYLRSYFVERHIVDRPRVARGAMAVTNFILTAAAVAAVASMMRYDVRGSTSMLRRNMRQVRIWMEEVGVEAKNGEMPKIENKSKPPTKDPSA